MSEPRLKPENVQKWNQAVDQYAADAKKCAAPEGKLLSASEKNFCAQNQIDFAFYSRAKVVLVRENVARGKLSVDEARRMNPEHANWMTAIYGFMRRNGWISGK